MRKIEIQRGKDGMKSQQFNQQVGATTGCTLRLLLDTIPQDLKTCKHGVRGDAWFGSIRTANEIGLRGHEAVLQVKQYHSLFPKEFIETALKDAPGGVHILLEGTTNDEVPLVALGYRYSRNTILFFVLTKNGGSSKLGDPYHMKYTDTYGNICTRYVDRPQVISNFFAGSNVIDTHNQLRQDSLKLEKKWVTQNPWFRLATTLVGINVTDAYLLCNYHQVLNCSKRSDDDQEKKITIQRFARILANQLIQLANKQGSGKGDRFLPEDEEGFAVSVTEPLTDMSSPTLTSSLAITAGKNVIRNGCDANGLTHFLVKYKVTQDPSGRKRTMMRKCKICLDQGKRRDVGQYCITCGESYSLCNKCDDRDCFNDHIKSFKRITRQTKKTAGLP
jgi:hypothetical protein